MKSQGKTFNSIFGFILASFDKNIVLYYADMLTASVTPLCPRRKRRKNKERKKRIQKTKQTKQQQQKPQQQQQQSC